MIKVTDLHKSFGKLLVLNGVTEHIKKGEAVSIIGPSGSGKSTFLRCLNLCWKCRTAARWSLKGMCSTKRVWT